MYYIICLIKNKLLLISKQVGINQNIIRNQNNKVSTHSQQMDPIGQLKQFKQQSSIGRQQRKQDRVCQIAQTITIPKRQYEQLLAENQKLRQQNVYLKSKFGYFSPLIMTKNKSQISRYSSYNMAKKGRSINNNKQGYEDERMFQNQKQFEKQLSEKDIFKQQMSEWSKRMNMKKRQLKISPIKIQRMENQHQNAQREQQPELKQAQKISLFKSMASINSNESLNSPFKIQQPNIMVSNDSPLPQKSEPIAPQDCGLKLIQSICLFGPEDIELKNVASSPSSSRSYVSNNLLYISNPKLAPIYSTYHPYFHSQDGVPARKLKQSQISMYGDQTIFRKNQVRNDCSLLLFEAKDAAERQKVQNSNQILDRVNGIKRLACFFVVFRDFCFVQAQEKYQQGVSSNKSVQVMQVIQKGESSQPMFKQASQSSSSPSPSPVSNRPRKKSSSYTIFKKQCIKTKFILCIFTYFPFINVMDQLVTSIQDEIKIRRVEKYAKQANLQKVDITYFGKQLAKISKELGQQIKQINIKVGEQIALRLGHFKIIFNFLENRLNDLLFGGWIFDAIKHFERDSLYGIFCNFMLEQHLVFVCQNLKLLTEVVFFFVSVLPNPFQYPHACICRAFKYQFLQSPFPVIIGLNQSSKWVQQFSDSYDRVIFIDLNGDEAKVKGKKKLNQVKSQKLKTIFSNLYKKMDNNSSPLPQIFKKKQNILKPVSRQQNQLVYTMLKSMQQYYFQQIFSHLPNKDIIRTMRQVSPQLNEHSKLTSIIQKIKTFILQSRRGKGKDKDLFVEGLLNAQIFYMYINKVYGLG